MPVRMQSSTGIKANLGIEPNGRVHKFFTNTCRKHMDKYVPKRDGLLRGRVDVQTDKIIYMSDYATYQYKGIREDGTHRVTHYTTEGTGPYWDKRMWTAERTKVIEEVQEEYRRLR